MIARLSLFALLVTLAACRTGGDEAAPAASGEAAEQAPLPTDVHSYAKPEEARVTHVALDLDADFDLKELSGMATLTFEAAEGAEEIVLDVRDLTIEGVMDASGDSLAYEVGESDPLLGAPLTVQIPESGETITVRYRTSPEAAAVQWLRPEQTASGQPFLFTQGQAILTRTWVPTQDSPGIRQTYEAEITVPESLTAVMSAEGNGDDPVASGEGARTFGFELDKAVPPYLIALAIGDLEFREIGERTGVWAEPTVVESAASEFVDVDAMMDAAEELYGPYRWGRYDVLVLPASFPFGGMENPLLTFATPTILAGDRSLVSLVAHELAHSWSGNLVTNATWDDFWINEGFTSYFENRIMEEVSGPEYAQMLESLSRTGLDEEITGLDEADQHLRLNLVGRDPDDGMNAIAYDKGALFLRTMEEAAGREAFDAWLRGYFDRHAFQPMTTDRLLADLDANLFKGNPALRDEVNPEAWIDGPGLPANAPRVESAAFARAEAQAEAFASGTAPGELETEGWSTHEWLHFMQSLPGELKPVQLANLDEAFGFSDTGNSEIRFAWLKTAIANEYDPAVPSLELFLTSQGRRKFVLPLFRDLAASEWGKPIADRIYRAARPGYHFITSDSVDDVLGVNA
ncbi:M1 family metallopeptidase [Rubricoccus marinus]|uniref:Aminopeptidase N n=1 Tax=Rubricoccus marinus TaxID=716817 RepID=A0A259U0I6_9BACT|nr:M1 family metallopeptidase [Rubricoccus marinus]OZC03456.1 aminopeptidase [Rubricoccus marinus]